MVVAVFSKRVCAVLKGLTLSLKCVTDLVLNDVSDNSDNTNESVEIGKWKHHMKDTYVTNLDVDAIRDFVHRIHGMEDIGISDIYL